MCIFLYIHTYTYSENLCVYIYILKKKTCISEHVRMNTCVQTQPGSCLVALEGQKCAGKGQDRTIQQLCKEALLQIVELVCHHINFHVLGLDFCRMFLESIKKVLRRIMAKSHETPSTSLNKTYIKYVILHFPRQCAVHVKLHVSSSFPSAKW